VLDLLVGPRAPHASAAREPHHALSWAQSCSGTPMNEKTIVAGSGKVSVETRSNGAPVSTASSSMSTVARIRSSIAATRRGVNARDAGRRRRVCAGGSSETIEG
jgi:hypothetical protein